MEEAAVTVDGETIEIPKPFFVMATQNPIEYEGTYPLPEAQLDRFLLKLKMGYPDILDEIEVLRRAESTKPIETLASVVTLEELIHLQQEVKQIHVDDLVKQYIVTLAQATREHPYVYLGASPRGSIALMKAAQAYTLLKGRTFVTPDDIQYLAPFVFAHRLILKPEARYDNVSTEDIVGRIVLNTAVPTRKSEAL